MRVKMSKQPPPAPTASAVGPCPTVIQIVGRPGTGSLPSTIAPPDHPLELGKDKAANAEELSPPSFAVPKIQRDSNVNRILRLRNVDV